MLPFTPEELSSLNKIKSKADGESDERNVLLGEFNSINQFGNKLRYQRGEAVPVLFRSSIPRLAMVKLGGTGLAAALTAAGASNRLINHSCALSAGINAIAVYFYYNIYKIRDQKGEFALERGRQDGETGAMNKKENAKKLFAQETIVDGLRWTDWAATLLLMQLELHNLATAASPGRSAPLFPKEYAAGLQTLFIGVASIGRFFLNQGRPDKDGRRASMTTILLTFIFYTIAFGIWLMCLLNLLIHVGDLDSIQTDIQKTDAITCYVLSIVQTGYVIVEFASVAYLLWNNIPGDEFPSELSIVKDVCYGSLDVTAKGGLALINVLRATWV